MQILSEKFLEAADILHFSEYFLNNKASRRKFLLLNNLLQYELLFLTDGAKDIKSHIEAVFAFHSHAVIHDWYHLKKNVWSI